MGKRLIFSFLLFLLIGALVLKHESPVHEVLAIRLKSPLDSPMERVMSALLETGHRINGFDFEGNVLVFSSPDQPYNGRVMIFNDENSNMVLRFHTYWNTRLFPFANDFSDVDHSIWEAVLSQNNVNYAITLDEVVTKQPHDH